MNKWVGMGRLTKDPEIRTGNTQVARYTLAVDRRFSNSEEKTDFINIVAFGKSAEFAEKYLKKGMKILVTGRIQTGSYTDKDGKKVYTTDIVVEEQEFAESKNASSESSQATTSRESSQAITSSDNDFMDIPANIKEDMPF
ncbi:MAG: single-stranded DNA-binding protein [Methanobrevibacter sp.]|nr:single-stranded DNA-binding protein [Methanobrevibacter sp.]